MPRAGWPGAVTSRPMEEDMTDTFDRCTRLAYSRSGSGEPLVLLHGQGLSRRSWDPVIACLTAHRDVIAVDLPGHGDSRRQMPAEGVAPADLAVAVTELLDDLGLDTVHVAGNSLGGWVALEVARLGRARTVTALSPAGLWRRTAPAYVRTSMRQSRLNSKLVRLVAPKAPQTRLARAVFMMTASGRPWSVPYEPAHRAVHDMASAAGFRETLRGLESSRFRGGSAIRVPVTVAFGSRDRVLLRGSARRRTELPSQTHLVSLRGCGHLAMVDAPRTVAALLLDGSRSDVARTGVRQLAAA
jgi:pimeloyl-ACP methyl ester carboxylesterase